MKLSATEKRIYALAQKWAKLNPHDYYGWESNADKLHYMQTARKNCGRALLKLFKEREGRG